MFEFDLIRRLQQTVCLPRDAAVQPCTLGIGDDAAVLDLPAGRQLVACTDSLVEGTHFLPATRADAIGHKALAVNLSDLAAMGAEPAWFLLALTLPQAQDAWLEAFADGMARLARTAGIQLAGGDVTTGPLNICVTALGLIEPGQALTRGGARAGDLIAVTGRPGAAARALQQLQAGETPGEADRLALDFPAPRLNAGRALRGLATSCIDLSDGLAADLGHLLEQSGLGATVELADLPCPDSLSGLAADARWPLQLAGGDDYELCFTLPPAAESRLAALAQAGGVEVTVIGRMHEGSGLEFRAPDGEVYRPPRPGYEHFRPGGGATR
jgi:thiamine-monophosphate kinase